MKRKTIYSCGLTLLIFCAVFYIYTNRTKQIHQKCPDDYGIDATSSAQYQEDFDRWTNSFYDTHPGATLGEWNRARYQFWVDNDCTEAIRRYYEAKSMNKTI
jgi:hypothetical protein